MDTLTIRQKLYEYIKVADDEKVEAMYTLIKDEDNARNEWWKNDDLVAELDRRSADLKDRGVIWEDVKKSLLNTMR